MPTVGERAAGSEVARVRDILANDSCSILSMDLMFGSYAPSGTYYVEASTEESLSRFSDELESRLVDAGGPIELSYSYDASGGYDAGETRDPAVTLLASLSTLMLLLMASYCQLSDSRRYAIVGLHGGGPLRAWLQTGGALLCVLTAILALLSLVCSLLVPGASPSLSASVAARVGLPLSAVTAASVVTSYLTKPKSAALALKGRENARGMAAACLVAKAVICVSLIGAAATVAAESRIIQEEQGRYANWAQTSGYATFFPLTTGYDADDMMGRVVSEIALGLYPAAVEEGALYIDSTQYLPVALENGGDELRSLVVNPNYLAQYPVLDAEGNPVSIEESERDWVLLVPEARRDDEGTIREYWESVRNPTDEALCNQDLGIFGKTVDDPPVGQEVRIVWIADGQSVFAFNPEVGVDDGGCVTDPIIEVLTLSNSVGVDRANAVTGGLTDALKVKVDADGPEATYERYLPLLRELGIDDNLKQLCTAEGTIFEMLQGFRDAQAQVAVKAGSLLIVSLFLAAQSASLLFEANVRRAAVKRLYGYGFLGREWPAIAVLAALWAASCAGAIFLSASLMPEVTPADAPNVAFAIAALVAVDAAVFLAALASAEKRRTMDVLKGAR